MLWMLEDLAKALVIIISFYKQFQTQGTACALAHDVKEQHFLPRHAFKTLVCFCIHYIHCVCFSEPYSHTYTFCPEQIVHLSPWFWIMSSKFPSMFHDGHPSHNHSPTYLVFCVTLPRLLLVFFFLHTHTPCSYKHCSHNAFLQDAMLTRTQNGPFHSKTGPV